jgi:hypothetical protein
MPPRLLAALRDMAQMEIHRIRVFCRTVTHRLAAKGAKLYSPHVRNDGGIFQIRVFDTCEDRYSGKTGGHTNKYSFLKLEGTDCNFARTYSHYLIPFSCS